MVGPPPPLPGVLEALNPAHYGDFDINDVPAFLVNFPNFMVDLGQALTQLPSYVASLDDYLNEVLESTKGFNNRASSGRWYAPPGVDIVLYEKAGHGGERLTLEGNGLVREMSNLHSESVDGLHFPPVFTGDLFRSMEFDGPFSSPAVESYAWGIVSTDPPGPFVLHDAGTATPTLDATGADGPATVVVELVVADSAGGVASTTTDVEVLNVGPIIDSIGPDRVIAEGEMVALAPVLFSDPGIPDTHTATIDWGDGSPLDTGKVTQDLALGGGEIAGSHAYGDDGTYIVTVTVTDDDGGSGSGVFSVEVTNLDPALTLDTSGATEFRAGPAFMGRVGVEQFHQASSTDPGSDDLRFAWSALEEVSGDLLDIEQTVYFNNGQSPDPFPSAPGTFPFAADDTAEATFARPGVYFLSVRVTDDDGGGADSGLPKLVAGDADCPRSIGDWRHQFATPGTSHVQDGTLLGLLGYVNFASSYFSEQVAAQSIAEARAVLKPGGADLGDSGGAGQHGKPDRSNMRGKAVQRLFAVWLGAASGALDLFEVLPDGATVLEALYAAEDILGDPSTKHRDHVLILQRMNAINNPNCP